MGILLWLLTGLIVGVIAKTLVKGPQNLGCLGTSVLGGIGSLVGGTVLNVISGRGAEVAASGFLGSIFGAVILLVLARLFRSPTPRTK
ncbi:MAG: GlsB/YeaQ/YmgE family stress response membrane protein [Acidimicrobiales bacterium]